MKNIKYSILALLISSITFAQEIIKIEIKENEVPCTGVVPMECLQVKEGKNKEWTYFYDSIENFEYELGYKYKLKVEKTKKNGNIPADASAYKYKLKKIISKKKVKETNKVANVNADIFNKKLVLVQLNGKPVTNGSVYFEFNKEEQTIYGKSGVNRFNSKYTYNNGYLNITPGMSTLMAGNPDAMKLENEFLNAINNSFKVKQEGNKFQFLDKSNKVIMVVENPTTKDIWTFINDKEWKLIMLENVGQDYKNASIKFNIIDKKITGNNGCNRFFGEFSTEADQIKIGSLATTRMACTNEEAKQTQDLMMKYLNEGTLKFDVAEQTLNFYKDNKLVMIFGLTY